MKIDDMDAEERWPDYTRTVAAQGIRSSLSVPLPFDSTTIGALNGYSMRSHAIGEEDCTLAEEVASWIGLNGPEPGRNGPSR
jgi:hypothetical protein